MYKRHKVASIVLFFTVFLFSFLLKADYYKIAEAAISVVSIALAVYIGAASVILGSEFASKLKKQQDSQIKTKTSLGVLSTYLRIAGISSIVTIIISSIYTLDLDFQSIRNIFTHWNCGEYFFKILPVFLSSFSCSLFSINVFFIWLILIFFINAMKKSV